MFDVTPPVSVPPSASATHLAGSPAASPVAPQADGGRRFVLVVDLPDDLPGEVEDGVCRRVTEVLASASLDLAGVVPAGTSVIQRALTGRTTLSHDVPRGMGVEVDLEARTVEVDGEQVRFPYKEFEILRHLLGSPGVIVSREQIAACVAELSPGAVVPAPRTVDVHVHRIRSKLGEAGRVVSTVRGVGYRYDPQSGFSVK